MTTVVLILCILGMIVCLYVLYRNKKVWRLRMEINQLCYEWSIANIDKQNAFEWLMKKLPSYQAMVYSFRKITLEEWIEKEDLKALLNNSEPTPPAPPGA